MPLQKYSLATGASVMAIMLSTPGLAQTSDASQPVTAVNEIVVTAQKREQSINDVPMTITAATGASLVSAGVQSTADLARIVPGLTAQPSPFNTPVYTLRGVGFYESSLAASPTVAVYSDEVPLPFSAMTKAAALDVQRVEVLKGPQGTLFGNNTTGGAINFVANRPTDTLEAGVDGSYEARFGQVDAQAFISGPIAGDLKGRIAGRVVEGGAWQHSITRPGDENGSTRMLQGRMLLDYEHGPAHFLLNVNGWTDRSDAQAPQRIDTYISVPTAPSAQQNRDYPYPKQDARSADWSNFVGKGALFETPNGPFPMRRDDRFWQIALRGDIEVSDTMTVTSITAYEKYKTEGYSDFDGTALNVADNRTDGSIKTFSQELRLAGTMDRLKWVVGGNYQKDSVYDKLYYYFGDSTTSFITPGLEPHMSYTSNFSDQDVKTLAAFGNVEFSIIDNLTIQGGVRYTDTKRKFAGCTSDEPGGGVAETFELLESVLRDPSLPFVSVPPGGCITFDHAFAPIVTPLQSRLNEDNVSWRVGVNYNTPNRGLVYATVSKGYKAGSFPTTSASSIDQYIPVKQESLLSYEAGFKQPVGGMFQVNGAFFYYDYRDKQLRGRVLDQVFGPLDALVQIPKSRVYGAEAEVQARPLDGLRLSVAATYLNTKIKEFTGYNNAGVIEDYAGARFPYAPKWQVVGDGQYDMPINADLNGFLGASFTYNSATVASIGDIPQLRIDDYFLLDLRAGIESADKRWKASVWGRNVTNAYYWSNALQTQDYYIRFTGKPATVGVSFSLRY